mmetsp:Transcript_28323/g.91357  ORF Transcript_28323/g.91357 Transcript_28323/m.91357 type:complete len:98 (+) Transcript_28323:534-827(+)
MKNLHYLICTETRKTTSRIPVRKKHTPHSNALVSSPREIPSLPCFGLCLSKKTRSSSCENLRPPLLLLPYIAPPPLSSPQVLAMLEFLGSSLTLDLK